MNINILIPNVGRRGYLVEYLKQTPQFEGKVYVSDCSTTAAGLYGDNDGHFILPKPVDDEARYISALKSLCLAHHIQIIIPVIDPEIFILSAHREEFASAGILVLVSDRRVLEICYNKIMMNDFLIQNGFSVPKTYHSVAELEKAVEKGETHFPVIVKPIYGSGSTDTYKLQTMDQVRALFCEEMMIQEFVSGEEYGIDTFNDLDQKPVRCVVKKKLLMRSGETDKSQTVFQPDIQKTLLMLARKLGHIGNLDSDVIVSGDRIYVLDLNPRFGGGYPATHAAGVNLLQLVLDLFAHRAIAPDFDHYQKDLVVMKEYHVRCVRLEDCQ